MIGLWKMIRSSLTVLEWVEKGHLIAHIFAIAEGKK